MGDAIWLVTAEHSPIRQSYDSWTRPEHSAPPDPLQQPPRGVHVPPPAIAVCEIDIGIVTSAVVPGRRPSCCDMSLGGRTTFVYRQLIQPSTPADPALDSS